MAASKRMKKGKTPEVHKPNVSGKIKEHAPRSEHVHLHQDNGHIRKNHFAHNMFGQIKMEISWYIIGIRSFLDKGMANQE